MDGVINMWCVRCGCEFMGKGMFCPSCQLDDKLERMKDVTNDGIKAIIEDD